MPARPRLKPPPPLGRLSSLLINTSRCVPSFLVIGIRLRGLFSSRTGRVSLLTGNSIFPRILGPDNFSTSIFSIVGGNSSAGSTGAVAATAGASSSFFFLEGFSTTCSGSSFLAFAPFLGRTEESIASRSIFLTTLGPSMVGASAFTTTSSTFSSFTGAGAGEAGAAGSSFFLVAFPDLNEISSSSFFLRTSPCAVLGSSSWSLFILAALSLWNSCWSERYISSVSLEVGFRSSLAKPFPTKNSIRVSCPMLNSLAAASNRGSFNSAIQLF